VRSTTAGSTTEDPVYPTRRVAALAPDNGPLQPSLFDTQNLAEIIQYLEA
jgi:hypothetical protein